MTYGLVFVARGGECVLVQIGGNGRLRLRDKKTGRVFWSMGVGEWSVHSPSEGMTFDSEEEAKRTAIYLIANSGIRIFVWKLPEHVISLFRITVWKGGWECPSMMM